IGSILTRKSLGLMLLARRQTPFLSPPRRGGVARSDGVVGFEAPKWCRPGAAGPPVRDTVASCPPQRGGQTPFLSPPRRGGVARSDGVVGFEAPKWCRPGAAGPPSATLSRPALLHRRAKSKAFPSSSRRGGAKRRGGGV